MTATRQGRPKALPDVGAVILAAGRGLRLHAPFLWEGTGHEPGSEERGEPKQYRPIGGVRILLRAIRPFAAHPRVGPIVLVLPPEDAARPPVWLEEIRSDRLILAAGGAERRQSVAHGLAALPAGPQGPRLVLIHDAARPFVDAALIDRVIAVAEAGAAAVPALPVSDTVKEADPSGLVVRTVSRERLVAVQTPQGFPRAMIETAHQRAGAEQAASTDDAQLCERLGYPVRVVAGSLRNIKVTTLDDLALAEALAAAAEAARGGPGRAGSESEA